MKFILPALQVNINLYSEKINKKGVMSSMMPTYWMETTRHTLDMAAACILHIRSEVLHAKRIIGCLF